MHRIPAHLIPALLLLTPTLARAAGPPTELVWQDRFAIGEHRDDLRNVVASDGHVVVDGLSWLERTTREGKRTRITHLSTYDLATGELAWRQQFRAKGGDFLFVEAGTVLLIRYDNFRTWAFDLATGEALWTSADRELETAVQASAVADGVLYMAGFWRPGDAAEFGVLVQARDPRSGTLLWEDRGAPAPPGRSVSVSALAAHNGLLAVASTERGNRFSGSAITAYDGRSGVPLWRRTGDETDLRLLDANLALCRGRLFASGTRSDKPFGSPHTLVVRALAANTGETVWERDFSEQRKTGFIPLGLRCAGPSAFAAALSVDRNDRSDEKLLLLALDRNRGAIRWQREFAGEDIFGRILQLGRRSVLFRKDNLLQAYSRRHGRLLWETDPYPEGGWSSVDLASDGRLAVAAGIYTEATKSDAVVRLLE